jgi:hypothetical protein
MENWVKKNKSWLRFLTAIISIWFISVIGIMTFKYWYFDLSWDRSRINLSNIINLGIVIGTIALAVFAWMAYKYATEQYLRNQKEKLIFKKKTRALTNIFNAIIMTEFTLK